MPTEQPAILETLKDFLTGGRNAGILGPASHFAYALGLDTEYVPQIEAALEQLARDKNGLVRVIGTTYLSR